MGQPQQQNKPQHLIAIVDDDPSVLRALGRLVSAFGYQVKLFDSGRQCLEDPCIDSAACLIIDVMMPGLNGFELHTLLTAAGHTTPTIFISAHDSSELKIPKHISDNIVFFNKLCDETLLYDAINNVLAT